MKRFSLHVLVFISFSISIVPLVGQAGTLDPEFGQNGKASISLGAYSTGTDLQVLPDGKILLAGRWQPIGGGGFSNFLIRLNTDGTIDNTFGINGKADTYPQPANFINPYRIAVQPDGKILALLEAQSIPADGTNRAVILRFEPNGTFDISFGVAGKAFSTPGWNVSPSSILIAPDGKIVVGGTSENNGAGTNFAIMRFLPDGSKDTTFGGEGKIEADFDSSSERYESLNIQPDGKIVAAGLLYPEASLLMLRLNDDGSPDTTFGTNGKLFDPFKTWNQYANAMKFLPDGKILLSGATFADQLGIHFCLFQLNADGSVDETFGDKGLYVYYLGGDYEHLYNTCFQSDEKILMGGTLGDPDYGFVLQRVNDDGTYDTGFGDAGVVRGTENSVFDGIFRCATVKLQPDDKIVALGEYLIGAQNDGTIPVYRFNADQNSGVAGVSPFVFPANVYPNPLIVNDVTIEYTLPVRSEVTILLHDINGQQVQTLLPGSKRETGMQKEALHLEPSLPSGIYFIELTAGETSKTVRIVKN